MKKIITIFPALTIFFAWAGVARAQLSKFINNPEINNRARDLGTNTGFNVTANVAMVLAVVINIFLGLMAIIFLILVIMAGFNYMNAEGDDKKVKKAQDTIRMAIIGMIIVAAAYAITYFVFLYLPGGTSTLGGGQGY